MNQISIKSKSGKVYSYDKKQILLDTDLYEDIKKISRKTVDKKYALTFADFKKMQSAQK